jgi:hypothetical protein
MQRPKLEIASWIAGVISAVLAAFAYISSPAPSSGSASSTVAAPEKLKQASTPAVPSIELKIKDAKNDELVEALTAAKSITSISERDSQLFSLVQEGVRRRELAVAFFSAKAITSISLRDNALYGLTCWTMNFRGTAEARSVASAITSISLRDDALKDLISNAATQGGGSEGVSCKKL